MEETMAMPSASCSTTKGSSQADAAIEVLRIGVEPAGLCPLAAPLHMEVSFKALQTLDNVFWRLRFIADTVFAQHKVGLGETSCTSYKQGAMHAAEINVPGIPTENIPATALESIGVLELVLVNEKDIELAVQPLVTDVRRCNGELSRVVLDPLS
mmetsp:Transcript_76002/g.134581  ORF Transcript_76002/g.134581 Transcript_76002/m.134581 type:complete len:155 (+) Transcript_76002:3-467(+)